MSAGGFKVPSLSLSSRKPTVGGEDGARKKEAAVVESGETPVSARSRPPAGEEEGEEEAGGCDKEGVLPAEGAVPLPYTEPAWSGPPAQRYVLSVIKNGSVVQELELGGKAYHVFGRLPGCDVHLEHPSVSRYHAVLQHRATSEPGGRVHTMFSTNPPEAGLYVYDLGSTHGTFLNKSRLSPRCYYRLREGQMVRFGGSSRLFLLESFSGDQSGVEVAAQEEIAAIASVQEMKHREKAMRVEKEERREDEGVTWGMVMEEVDLAGGGGEDVEVDEEREAYYRDDPKKALRKFFEREGLELEYETDEEGQNRSKTFTTRLRLPIETASGEAIFAEGSVCGRKKDAVVACALEACRLLDSQDMLRRPSQGHQQRKRDWEENDYYDSDEDIFLDRTGQIEQKRQERMRRAGRGGDCAENYQSLVERHEAVMRETVELEERLARAKQDESEGTDSDALEVFMSHLGDQLDSSHLTELKHRLHELRREGAKLMKLAEVARPTELPGSTKLVPTVSKPAQSLPAGSLAQPSGIPSAASSQPTSGSMMEQRQEGQQCTRASPSTVTPSPSTSTITPPTGTLSPSTITPPTFTPSPPTITPPTFTPSPPTFVPSIVPPITKKPRHLSPDQPKKGGWEDPDYSSWLPPDNQSGDGRTHLNEKFGY